MSEKKPVVVYGASGYTGRLVCEYLRELNIPFTAAGRDRARVQSVMDKIPGIETADYDVVEVAHTTEALTELFTGVKVVSNMVGPFSQFGPEAVEACLAAGCHYTDTTGEQDWVMSAKERWGAQFAAKGLLLSPGIAQMYTTGEIAANICLETPGLDTLDILVLWKGFSDLCLDPDHLRDSSGQMVLFGAKQIYRMGAEHAFRRETFPASTNMRSSRPGLAPCILCGSRTIRASPIAKRSVAFSRAPVMEGFVSTQKMFEEQIKPLAPAEQQAALAQIAASIQAGIPPRENPRINISLDSVYASGPLGRAHCVIHGNCNYKQTGLLQAHAAYSLLQTPPKTAGFASGCQAFGHRDLLGVLKRHGLVMEPVVTVHQ